MNENSCPLMAKKMVFWCSFLVNCKFFLTKRLPLRKRLILTPSPDRQTDNYIITGTCGNPSVTSIFCRPRYHFLSYSDTGSQALLKVIQLVACNPKRNKDNLLPWERSLDNQRSALIDFFPDNSRLLSQILLKNLG